MSDTNPGGCGRKLYRTCRPMCELCTWISSFTLKGTLKSCKGERKDIQFLNKRFAGV